MKYNDILEKFTHENRKRVKNARLLGLGIGVAATASTATAIYYFSKLDKKHIKRLEKKTVQNIEAVNKGIYDKVGAVTSSQIRAVHKASDTIQDVIKKSDDVKDDIKDGYQKLKKDAHKTAENIANDFN